MAKVKGGTTIATHQKNGKGEFDLRHLFIESLQDLYWTEKKLSSFLSDIKKVIHSTELKQSLSVHIAQTVEHTRRLKTILKLLGKKPGENKPSIIQEMIEEGKRLVKRTQKGSMVRDAGLIIALQKLEHYEIASYGALKQLAITMNYAAIAKLLGQTLKEVKLSDAALSEIAESGINWQADEENKKHKFLI